MTQPVRVLYVGRDDSAGRRLESLFADGWPAIALSFVPSVEGALRVLDDERIDHVVVDSTVAEAEADRGDPAEAIRREAPVVRVTALRKHEGVSALARRIADAVTFEMAADGGIESEHFRALAEGLSDVILVIGADSTVRYANPAVSEVFGYEPDELVGGPLTELMPPDLAERHREGLGRYLREGERHLDWSYVELTGQRRDGTEIPLGISFSEFGSGDERRFTGVVRDVSEQKRRESQLRDRVRQQEALATFSRHALEDWSVADLTDEAVELVADALGQEYAGALEYRPDEDDLVVRSVVGWDEDLVDSATIGTEQESQAGYTLMAEEPVVTEDLTTEDRYRRDELLAAADAACGISVVVGSPDDPWGILGSHSTETRSYTAHDVQFVQSIANVLTAAVQRREREAQLERYEAMLNAVGDAVYALDADSRYVAVNDAYLELTGYDREQLLGEHAETVIGSEVYEDAQRLQAALEDSEEVATLETTMPTADGGSVPVEARISAFSLGDGDFGRVGVVRDVSDRKRREEKLTSLNALFRSLADAETQADICDLGVAAAVETLELPNAAVALYDDETGTLVPTVRRWRGGDVDDALLGAHAEDVAWQVFVDGETRTFEDLSAEVDADARMAAAMAVPLGKHGVFVAASPERAAFDATDRSLADMLCSNVRSALDRAEREETLREQRNDLQEKNRELERVNRINRVIREITKALTRASSRDDVIQAVCDSLTDTGPYRLAWFGTHDRATGEVRPEAWAGVEEGYLDEIRVTADDDVWSKGPAGRAVRTEELQVQNDLLGDPPFEPWREQALKRGYRSCVSVPVTYGGTLRGVLQLYADEADVFDETERAVLSELGETIGYALNALEQERALVSERSIELDFRIGGTDNPILGFVAETGAEFEFGNVVQNSDGLLRAFFTLQGVTPEETVEFADGVPWVEDLRLVTERDGEYLYECVLSADSFVQSLVNRGAMPRRVTATPDGGRFVIRVPQSTDVRPFVDLFEDYYHEAQLVARRERDEPVVTRHEFEAELDERLTDRQREVLRTAYFSGFFEWPRESTAEDLADALGVSQPTVSRHIRAGEQALFGLLFDDE